MRLISRPFLLTTSALLVAAIVGALGLRAVAIEFLTREADRALAPATSVIAAKLGQSTLPADVCLIGDSRAAEWKTFPHESVLNLGIPSATTAEIAGAVASLGNRQLGQLVVIQCGINDLKTLPYTDRDVGPFAKTVASNIIEITIEQIGYGSKRVIVTGVFPTGPVALKRRPFWGAEIEDGRLLVNAILRDQATETGYIYLDTEAVLADHALYRDTLHLNADGYAALDTVIAESLRQSGPLDPAIPLIAD